MSQTAKPGPKVTAWTIEPRTANAPVVFAENYAQARHLLMHQSNLQKWPKGVRIVPATEDPATPLKNPPPAAEPKKEPAPPPSE